MSERIRIRTATAADAEPLAALAEQTFRDTFTEGNSTANLEEYARSAFTLDQLRGELAEDANSFLLAFLEAAERPIGYAKLRTGVTPPCVTGPAPVELHRIYVNRSALGHGVGAALMQASLDAARWAGHRTVWLGVWEDNARAISFYERWGFTTVGDQVFLMGSDPQRDLIMVREVSGESFSPLRTARP